MKVRLICNAGSGLNTTIEVEEGTTIGILLVSHANVDPVSMGIRRNGEAATPNDLVQDGDRISAVPRNIRGAA